MRKIRARDVLLELQQKNVKKIGKEKISELEKKEELDYDMIMTFYANYLKKEKDAIEVEKKKKIKEVEWWARALREEEKLKTEAYCRTHGEEEVKGI